MAHISAIASSPFPFQPEFAVPDQAVLAWYALQVKYNQERSVARALRERGFEEFAPLAKEERVWSDRVKSVVFPLFPGYVFARFDIRQKSHVLAVPGVKYLVNIGKNAAEIAEGEIVAVRTAVESKLPVSRWESVLMGTPVTIERGPLRGLTGNLETVKNNFRLIISVSMLQRSIAVELNESWVHIAR